MKDNEKLLYAKFKRVYLDTISEMPEELQGWTALALMRYALDQKKPDFSQLPEEKRAWAKSVLKSLMSIADTERNIHVRNVKNGQKGGHEKGYGIGNQNARKLQKELPNEPKAAPLNEPKTNPKDTAEIEYNALRRKFPNVFIMSHPLTLGEWKLIKTNYPDQKLVFRVLGDMNNKQGLGESYKNAYETFCKFAECDFQNKK